MLYDIQLGGYVNSFYYAQGNASKIFSLSPSCKAASAWSTGPHMAELGL